MKLGDIVWDYRQPELGYGVFTSKESTKKVTNYLDNDGVEQTKIEAIDTKYYVVFKGSLGVTYDLDTVRNLVPEDMHEVVIARPDVELL